MWKPAYELRGTHRHWLDDARLASIDMSERAAQHIYDHFCLFPELLEAANDRDNKRW